MSIKPRKPQRHGSQQSSHYKAFAPLKRSAETAAERPLPEGLFSKSNYLDAMTYEQILSEIEALEPIWENRFSQSNPPPAGQNQRRLLRPVYWLGNWQFACLNYYHPPKGIEFRCVEAEPYPTAMGQEVLKMEEFIRANYKGRDLPRGWKLNTCLVNYYGSSLVDGKWADSARVGEHKDFEPGPVASLSFGERALFQFVSSEGKLARSDVRFQMWLEDNAFQTFGCDKWKKHLFHRVQRVEDKHQFHFHPSLQNYRTRRLNLTFRYVPDEHIQPLSRFPEHLIRDVRPYIEQLAQTSSHFRQVLTSIGG